MQGGPIAARAGLQDPNRPLGSFLFLGPTGVGKTELARALAEFLFDDERALVRLDVNRQEEQRLIFGALNRPAWKTEVPVPITNRFGSMRPLPR